MVDVRYNLKTTDDTFQFPRKCLKLNPVNRAEWQPTGKLFYTYRPNLWLWAYLYEPQTITDQPNVKSRQRTGLGLFSINLDEKNGISDIRDTKRE